MPRSNKDRPRLMRQDHAEAYRLILPFFVFFTIFVLYPIAANFYYALTDYNLSGAKFIGLRNFRLLLQDREFLRSIRNTALFAAGAVLPQMALGFLAALCFAGRTRRTQAARTILMFPYVVSMVAASLIWLFLLDPGAGVINCGLRLIGLPGSDWLFDEHLALPTLIMIHIWKNIGYTMILYAAAIQGVSASQLEAARVDGAGWASRVRRIIWPGVRPVSAFLLATLTIESFKTFDQVRIMTDGGPVNATTTMTHQIYRRAFSEFRFGYASAEAVILFLLILAVTVLHLRWAEAGESAEKLRR